MPTFAEFLTAAALAWLPACWRRPASAQNYPSRVVRWIVPFGAGGPADVYARILAAAFVGRDQAGLHYRKPPGAGP